MPGYFGSLWNSSIAGSSVASAYAAEEAIASSSRPFGGIVRQNVTPLNKYPPEQWPVSRETTLQQVKGSTVKLTTIDGYKLDAVWSPTANMRVSPTVVVFHGNGCTLDSMAPMGEWFHNHGINVLMVTMRGYPGSEGDAVRDGELGYYKDVEAAMRFVIQDQKVDRARLFAHGFSLGGALAAAAARFYNIPATLDHTFTSAAAVMNTIARQSIALPESVTKGIARGAFPVGETLEKASEDQLPSINPVKTDALNSLAKIETSDRSFFVLYGKNDEIMPTYFADAFYESRYGKIPSEDKPEERKAYQAYKARHVVEMAGGHNEFFVSDPQACRKYEEYLAISNLMDSQYLS